MRGNWVISAAIVVGLGVFFLALARELGREARGESPVARQTDPEVWASAVRRLQGGEFGRAAALAQEYANRRPEDGVAWGRLAWTLELAQREPEAERAWGRALALLETGAYASRLERAEEWIYLGSARLRRGDDRAAARALQQGTAMLAQMDAKEVGDDHAPLADLARRGWERLGDSSRERMAIEQIERGLVFGETASLGLTRRALGMRLRALGDASGAQRLLLASLKRAEADLALQRRAESAYDVAALRALTGDIPGALDAWEEAVRLGFRRPVAARADEDLAALRGEERFEAGLRALEAAQAERTGSGG